ncbi:IQ motif, EF-hand binding site [Phytophthora cactorum]|nr:IQ motif, EF-hand binding site [Phytophthora cactorum]
MAQASAAEAHSRQSQDDTEVEKQTRIDLASYIAGLLSRVERLRSDREAYHLKCGDIQQELQQVRLDIEIVGDKISDKEKEVANLISKTTAARDSSVVLKDAVKLVKSYQNEVAELEELELNEHEPVVHVAATVIQAFFRGVHCRMEQIRDQQRQRQTYTRMLQSKESCYDRMHAALTTRNQKLWNASARTIVGLYHIQQAKIQRHQLRRKRAGRRISRLYLDVKARTSCTAKQDLLWMKVKRQAKEIATRKLHTLLQLTWSGWLRYVQEEDQRRNLIAEREAAGLNQWCNAKAKWFLSAYQARIIKRVHLECEVMPRLNRRVLHHIRAAIQTKEEEPSIESAQDISSTFLLLIRNDIWTWREPHKQLHVLAERYNLPLGLLNLEQINRWLAEEAPSFVDLYAPLPTQTLLFLNQLSTYFSRHSHVLVEVQRIHEVYEAHMLAREYLTLLYAGNVVRLSPSTTFSAHQRQRAVDILQEKDHVEYLPISTDNEVESGMETLLVKRNAFTSFHCVRNHRLCERCLVIRAERNEASVQCKSCGHHHYERNTVARDLQLKERISDNETGIYASGPTQKLWVSTIERCDFVVVNAFLHDLAPVNHENRRSNSLDMLWKLAVRNAREPLADMYTRLPTGSLNDLLNASRRELEAWTKDCCSPGVDARLHLFITTMKDEWMQVDTQLSLEAQVAATISSQQKLQIFQNGSERLQVQT